MPANVLPGVVGRPYLGMLWMARFGAVDEHGSGNNEGTIHVELAWSRDGDIWSRPPGKVGPRKIRPQLLPRGPAGAWDSEMVMTSTAPFDAVTASGFHVTRLSYLGCPFLHSTWQGRPCAVGLASIRRHGFASLRTAAGAASPQSVTTVALGPGAVNATLMVNYAVGRGGSLKIALLTGPTTNVEVAGYGIAQCVPLTGNATAQNVRWEAAATMPTDGRVTQMALRFVMEGAVDLYGFALARVM